MESKAMSKNRIVYVVIGFIILILMANLAVNFYIKSNAEPTATNYTISRMQISDNLKEKIELIPFFNFFLPLSNGIAGDIREIHPDFIGDDLKAVEINRGLERKNILIEVSELSLGNPSALKWVLMKEYRLGNYDEYKNNLLSANWKNYSWWNLYRNLKLLLYMMEKGKNIPEGLKEINILTFEDYQGYLEHYEIDKSTVYFGYNFVIGKNCYNIMFSGYSNKSDVLDFVISIKRIKNIEHEYDKVYKKYKNNGVYSKEVYLLSAISLMPSNNSLYKDWEQLYGGKAER